MKPSMARPKMKIEPQPYSAMVGRFRRLMTAAMSISARLPMPRTRFGRIGFFVPSAPV